MVISYDGSKPEMSKLSERWHRATHQGQELLAECHFHARGSRSQRTPAWDLGGSRRMRVP
jgi:hypothetical protein